MKIKTIGTGSISADERSACTLIDEKILIDCGNGITKTLLQMGIDLGKIDILLITHLHGDHFFDIPFLILTKAHRNIKNKLYIYCPIGTINKVKDLLNIGFNNLTLEEICKNSNTEFIEFDNLEKEVIDNYYVKSYKVVHGSVLYPYGYTITKDNKTIGISGDSTYCDSIDKIVSSSDISILDMSRKEENKAHMGISEIKKIILKYNKKVIATHIQEDTRKIVKNLNIENLIIPNDGDEFEI